jgi:hypothetical protein
MNAIDMKNRLSVRSQVAPWPNATRGKHIVDQVVAIKLRLEQNVNDKKLI